LRNNYRGGEKKTEGERERGRGGKGREEVD